MICVPRDSSRLPGSCPCLSRAATLRPRCPLLRTAQSPWGHPKPRRSLSPGEAADHRESQNQGSTGCHQLQGWESQDPTAKEPTAHPAGHGQARYLPPPRDEELRAVCVPAAGQIPGALGPWKCCRSQGQEKSQPQSAGKSWGVGFSFPVSIRGCKLQAQVFNFAGLGLYKISGFHLLSSNYCQALSSPLL